MTTRQTMVLWSIYVTALGLVLLVAPNPLITLFGAPPTSETWIRVLGAVVLILAFYYAMALREDVTALYRWSVPARLAVPVVFAALVLWGGGHPSLILFGLVDAAGALLTLRALRAENG